MNAQISELTKRKNACNPLSNNQGLQAPLNKKIKLIPEVIRFGLNKGSNALIA